MIFQNLSVIILIHLYANICAKIIQNHASANHSICICLDFYLNKIEIELKLKNWICGHIKYSVFCSVCNCKQSGNTKIGLSEKWICFLTVSSCNTRRNSSTLCGCMLNRTITLNKTLKQDSVNLKKLSQHLSDMWYSVSTYQIWTNGITTTDRTPAFYFRISFTIGQSEMKSNCIFKTDMSRCKLYETTFIFFYQTFV